MKIAVVGTGYVGLTLSCLADRGHEILFIGRSKGKIDMINKGKSPIYEPGLEEILERNVKLNKIKATADYNEIKNADVVFVCVGTPSQPDGSIDLSQIESASTGIGEQLRDSSDYKVVIVKSTVVPGTSKNFVVPILEKNSNKKAGVDFGVGMSPEFLRESTAVYDFMNPEKIVIGCTDDRAYDVIERVFSHFDSEIPRVKTDLSTAEMIKYAQNSALAARISFINEIANICEKFQVDVYDVARAIGLDSRIGPKALQAGAGFGGSCFPKDVKALQSIARSVDIEPKMLNATLDINALQPYRTIELLESSIGNVDRKTIAVLGLAFKPDTDDMRDSPSIPIVRKLVSLNARVKVYDPKAMENSKDVFKDSVEYCNSKEECLEGADACLIVTNWKEFKEMDLSSIKIPLIDGRRTVDPNEAEKFGVNYKGIGWKGN